MNAVLVLEDGTFFEGKAFGSKEEKTGEVVFNTSMTGYQEILTDPSYKGQIVTMTYPHIGNYGINPIDVESGKPWVEGFVAKEFSKVFSNFRAAESLEEYLIKNNIIGIEGIDTRALTRHIRLQGAMRGIISACDTDIKNLVKKVRKSPDMVGRDLVKEVTCREPYVWNGKSVTVRFKVICYDYGAKYSILKCLSESGCQLKIVPAGTKAEDVLAEKPDGLFLSNGPGDPAAVLYAIENIKKLIGKIPVFGICLGHQLIGLALGGKTYKLKFGHHGGNQPVMDLKTKKVEITAQNHGFAVDINSLDKNAVELTHINLNDNTVEGIRHRKLPLFSVQYHPEAGPGPHDAKYLFKQFVEMMEQNKM